MKLYTKRGDDGGTDLLGGQRVGKDALRVEAYGTIDELSSALGLAASGAGCPSQMRQMLSQIQNRLFDAGADLAAPRGAQDAEKVARIGPDHAGELERRIDQVCEHLSEVKHFILPGGSETAARLHLARTICRRAERLVVALGKQENIGPDLVVFLNRLSDLLFALARRANQLAGVEDVPWKPR